MSPSVYVLTRCKECGTEQAVDVNPRLGTVVYHRDDLSHPAHIVSGYNLLCVRGHQLEVVGSQAVQTSDGKWLVVGGIGRRMAGHHEP